MPKDINDLTARQRKFIIEYMGCTNATKAAKLAFNPPNTNSAAVMGSRLLRNPIVKAEIDRLLGEKAKAVERKLTGSTKQDGTIDPRDYDTDAAMIEAEALRSLSQEIGNLSIASAMVQHKAKLKGLLVEKVQMQAAFSINIVGIQKPQESPKSQETTKEEQKVIDVTKKKPSIEDLT